MRYACATIVIAVLLTAPLAAKSPPAIPAPAASPASETAAFDLDKVTLEQIVVAAQAPQTAAVATPVALRPSSNGWQGKPRPQR